MIRHKLKISMISVAILFSLCGLMPQTVQAEPSIQETIDWLQDFLKRKALCREVANHQTEQFKRISYDRKSGNLFLSGYFFDGVEKDVVGTTKQYLIPIARLRKVEVEHNRDCYEVRVWLDEEVMYRRKKSYGEWEHDPVPLMQIAYTFTREDANRIAKALEHLAKIVPRIESKELF